MKISPHRRGPNPNKNPLACAHVCPHAPTPPGANVDTCQAKSHSKQENPRSERQSMPAATRLSASSQRSIRPLNPERDQKRPQGRPHTPGKGCPQAPDLGLSAYNPGRASSNPQLQAPPADDSQRPHIHRRQPTPPTTTPVDNPPHAAAPPIGAPALNSAPAPPIRASTTPTQHPKARPERENPFPTGLPITPIMHIMSS